MLPEKTSDSEKNKASLQPLPTDAPSTSSDDNEHVEAAYEQAEEDIEKDPDTIVPEPADDLDEGESVRLDDDENGLI